MARDRYRATQGTESLKADEETATAACEQCRTRKVRCDRILPRCSHCKKADVVCIFANREKRVNHVHKLVEDVSSLSMRLEAMDQTMSKMSSLLERFSALTPPVQPSLPPKLDTQTSLDIEDMESLFRRDQSSDLTQSSDFNVVHDDITPRALFNASRKDLATFLSRMTHSADIGLGPNCTNNPATPSPRNYVEHELRVKHENFPLNMSEYPPLSVDEKTVTLPPRCLLESCLPDFLDHFNMMTPIFEESTLKAAIDLYYSGMIVADEAYHLCFNNIIVLTLGLRSRLARIANAGSDHVGYEAMYKFLNNSCRALSRLNSLLRPQLICCQALATLAMVVREYHQSNIFNNISHVASLNAKSIGLQKFESTEAEGPSSKTQEKRNLYWVIFIMDKQRSFISGEPFDLHFYDSDARLLSDSKPESLSQHCQKAHIHMMAIWEQIYIYLYSLRAYRKSQIRRQQDVMSLDRFTRRWYSHYGSLLSTSPSDEISIIDLWLIELKYTFHVGQVLIHRCSRQESSQQLTSVNSRAALNIIRDVFRSNHSLGSVMLLSRLFRLYPLVSVHELFSSFLRSPSAELVGDLNLICDISEALDTLCEHKIVTACLNLISTGLKWYSQIAQIFLRLWDVSDTAISNNFQPSLKRPHNTKPSMTDSDVDQRSQKRRRNVASDIQLLDSHLHASRSSDCLGSGSIVPQILGVGSEQGIYELSSNVFPFTQSDIKANSGSLSTDFDTYPSLGMNLDLNLFEDSTTDNDDWLFSHVGQEDEDAFNTQGNDFVPDTFFLS